MSPKCKMDMLLSSGQQQEQQEQQRDSVAQLCGKSLVTARANVDQPIKQIS